MVINFLIQFRYKWNGVSIAGYKCYRRWKKIGTLGNRKVVYHRFSNPFLPDVTLLC
uniref:Uncharacterized protein n=1 Tax=Kuenenia stuttgartiensis TaxID=174633 RepID=Q1Q2K3_KUEST|nr:unknown protein [Candidatus Kuenenia stuttgartiensis]